MMRTDAVIFDFDDTLVITNDLYDKARLQVFDVFRSLGFTGEEEWAAYLEEADLKRVAETGYLSHACFPQAIDDTYRHFAARSGKNADEEQGKALMQLGWQVHFTRPTCIEGAVELLEALHGKVRLFLLTQGDADTQEQRLQGSGLLPYFDGYAVVRKKDTAAYRQFIERFSIQPSTSWMVGNSIRSDINPALSVGLQAVLFRFSTWSYDRAEPAGAYLSVDKLHEVLNCITV